MRRNYSNIITKIDNTVHLKICILGARLYNVPNYFKVLQKQRFSTSKLLETHKTKKNLKVLRHVTYQNTKYFHTGFDDPNVNFPKVSCDPLVEKPCSNVFFNFFAYRQFIAWPVRKIHF